MFDNYFNYKKYKTDFKTEVIAGVSTFLTVPSNSTIDSSFNDEILSIRSLVKFSD